MHAPGVKNVFQRLPERRTLKKPCTCKGEQKAPLFDVSGGRVPRNANMTHRPIQAADSGAVYEMNHYEYDDSGCAQIRQKRAWRSGIGFRRLFEKARLRPLRAACRGNHGKVHVRIQQWLSAAYSLKR
jgi:hypothetical protein